ncbi:Imm51 family immunity protein [Paenibacillus eucommiae]|uniref:Tetratricopeptide (TPR) repeat protein n=1 Tax=Paenibacillus eucommiae TaxID=1355755 RepID=A0ABS4IXJ7_9BACL|nr:Imm51 family immunity protein [Paenibacillus eucommiae]MBP1992318.1 tetratricopeptide (TPR) repeat protein [Paenibacillus eucommiae]
MMDNELLQQLNLWHENSEYKKIIHKIKQIPEADRDYDLLNHLARALNNLDKHKEALEILLSVQEQGESDPLWHFRVGYAHYYSEQYEEAIQAFEQVLKLDPKDSVAKMLLEGSRRAVDRNASEASGIEEDTFAAVEAEDGEIIEDELNPFMLVSHKGGNQSLILSVGTYKDDIFQARAAEGFEGNGYDWASLAAVFLEEKMPDLVGIIKFDPEAGMFAAYTDNKEAMQRFAAGFKDACENDTLIRDLFSRAELD